MTTKETNNLNLWDAHRTPHKDALKSFTRGGGFSGTAIDPMWLIREATSEWGPMGGKWGIKDVEETVYEDGPDGTALHVCRLTVYYPDGEVPCVGQTMIIAKDSRGIKFDEEAPKKSMTDAISKALSWLGFGADIHMNAFDGNKYADLTGNDTHDRNQACEHVANRLSADKHKVVVKAWLPESVKTLAAALQSIRDLAAQMADKWESKPADDRWTDTHDDAFTAHVLAFIESNPRESRAAA